MISSRKGKLYLADNIKDSGIDFEVVSVENMRFEIVSEVELDADKVYKSSLTFQVITHECIFRVVSSLGENRYLIDLVAPNNLMTYELKNIG